MLFAGVDVIVSQCSRRDVKRNLNVGANVTCSEIAHPECEVTRSRFTCSESSLRHLDVSTRNVRCSHRQCKLFKNVMLPLVLFGPRKCDFEYIPMYYGIHQIS